MQKLCTKERVFQGGGERNGNEWEEWERMGMMGTMGRMGMMGRMGKMRKRGEGGGRDYRFSIRRHGETEDEDRRRNR